MEVLPEKLNERSLLGFVVLQAAHCCLEDSDIPKAASVLGLITIKCRLKASSHWPTQTPAAHSGGVVLVWCDMPAGWGSVKMTVITLNPLECRKL